MARPPMRRVKHKVNIEFEVEYNEVQWDNHYIPEVVYKYRSWTDNNHQKILRDNSIWVPDTLDFNDPFDCDIPIAYEQLASDDNVARKFIRRLIKGKPEFQGRIDEEVDKRLKDNRHKDPEFISHYKELLKIRNKKAIGIFSVTPVIDNILMWSHYADSHKGFCIGFDSIKLFEQLAGGGGEVLYSKDYPIISPVEPREQQYLKQVLTKSVHWAYEIEYRLVTLLKNNLTVPLEPKTIVEVIFGSRISPEHKDKIKAILRKSHPHVKCFTAAPDKNKFALTLLKEEL